MANITQWGGSIVMNQWITYLSLVVAGLGVRAGVEGDSGGRPPEQKKSEGRKSAQRTIRSLTTREFPARLTG